MTIIVTGFEPFLNNEVNPTSEVLGLLPSSIRGNDIITVRLPVEYDRCFDVLKPYIEKYNPGMIILLGLAPTRKNICIERVALNVSSSKYEDNSQIIKTEEKIIEDGKNAYFSTLPMTKIYNILKKKRIPVEISNTAGLYICNNVAYHVLHHIEVNNMDIKAGLIHVPFMTKQVKDDSVNSLPLVIILEGIIDTIKATL